jgi:outer membrane protein OmpA-like peptidoglycan-associated protein
VAAALGVGVLFGHGLGTRGALRFGERPDAAAEAPRAQGPQPALEAPLTPSRNVKESASAADDGPEVIVRTFPQSAPSQAEGAVQGPVQANVKAIFFDVDVATVSRQYDITLQRIAELLEASPQSNAIIEGHTDSSGVEPYNLELSTRRALAVRERLENQYNIPAERLNTVGAGSFAPIESNATSSGRAYNRRVEVRIMQPGGGSRVNP